MSNRNVEIANEIIRQMGGNKLVAMTGAKNFGAIENGVQFKIGKNSKRVNTVKITLNAMDTYDVEYSWFAKKRGTFEYVNTVKASENGIYNDMLKESFERNTGMYTSF